MMCITVLIPDILRSEPPGGRLNVSAVLVQVHINNTRQFFFLILDLYLETHIHRIIIYRIKDKKQKKSFNKIL